MKKKMMSILSMLLVLSLVLMACANGGGGGADTPPANDGGEVAAPADDDDAGDEADDDAGDEVVDTMEPADGEYRGTVRVAWLGLGPDDTVDPISGLVFRGSQGLKELVEEKLPGVEVEFIMIPSDGWIQNMETTILSGEADVGWFTNQVMAAKWFVDHRYFMENDPDFTLEDFENTFTYPARFLSTYRTFTYPEYTGAILGLPYAASAHFIVYDAVMFEQWGVEPLPMHPSFDDIRNAAEQMTGTNPVTGEHNYGVFLSTRWSEWLGIGADIYPIIDIPSMDIRELDIETDVGFIRDNPRVLEYFKFLEDMIQLAPVGAAAGSGYEMWPTPDNNIAIMLDAPRTSVIYNHVRAGNTEVTDRFIPVLLPRSEAGISSFPEIQRLAVSRYANDPWLAWEVIKVIATDIDVQNYLLENISFGQVPALVDTTGIHAMDDPFTRMRYEDRLTGTFLTDDFWFWRDPLRILLSGFFAGEFDAYELVELWYQDTVEWVENKIESLGFE